MNNDIDPTTLTPVRLGALLPFIAMLKKYSGWLLLGFLLTVLTLVCGIGLLTVSGWFLTGTAIAGLSESTALVYNFFAPAATVRGFAIFRTLGRWSERVVNHEAVFRQLASFRAWLFRALVPLSIQQLNRYHGATLLSRMTRDIDALDNLYVRLLLPVAAALLLLLAAMAAAVVYMPLLLIPLAALLLVSFVIVPLLAWRLGRDYAPAAQRQMGQLRVQLLELVDGLETLSLNKQAWKTRRQQALAASKQYLASTWQLHKRSAFLQYATAAIVALMALLALALLSFGGWGAALTGGATLLFLAFGEMLTPLPGAWLKLPGTCRAADDLSRLQAEKSTLTYPAVSQQTVADNSLSIAQLWYSYQADVAVLCDINIDLRAGQQVLLQGASGGGKTTLIQLLTRQLLNQQGSICLGGAPIESLSEDDLRRLLALSPQDTYLFADTLAYNLRIAAPTATDDELWQVLEVVGLADFVKQLPQGLATWTDEGGTSLSGGQRRRLGVARALLADAEVVILDEPTEGLDLAAEKNLIADVQHYLAGKTLLWVSHRNTARDSFDLVLTLSEGRLNTTTTKATSGKVL